MVARGHVENGVIVLDDGVRLPEGQEVTVVARVPENAPESFSKERREAILSLIGIWNTANPPTDEEVKHILEEERMKKHG
jgi:predicted DNA-binding antitoxin AbrB/MazE fold protein